MTTVLTTVVEILLEWAETGAITDRQYQRPAGILVDCSNGVDIRLRGLSERSMDDLMRRIERIPEILMMLRLLDYAAKDNRKIKKQGISTRPYATTWLDLLSDLLHERHDEAPFIHRQMDHYGENLADALGDDFPEAAEVLRNEGSQPSSIRRLAAALTPLMGTKARRNTFQGTDQITVYFLYTFPETRRATPPRHRSLGVGQASDVRARLGAPDHASTDEGG